MWKTAFVTLFAIGVLANYEDELKVKVIEQCKKNHVEDKREQAETEVKNFSKCMRNLVDSAVLREEIKEAKPNGTFAPIIKKYCDKSTELKSCVHTMSRGVAPCFDESMQERIIDSNTSVDDLVDYICYKDGERVLQFIAEDGTKCVVDHALDIERCIFGLDGSQFYSSLNDVDGTRSQPLAKVDYQELYCRLFDHHSACVVQPLESCASPVPAEFTRSLLGFVRNSLRCKSKLDDKQ